MPPTNHDKMKLLFISWSTTGGSGISQRQLARYLLDRGHEVRFLVFDQTASSLWTYLYDRLSDTSVRHATTPLSPLVIKVRDSIGRTGRRHDLDDIWHLHTPIPQNALSRALDEFNPDMVVVNSVDRWAWRRIHETCRKAGTPTVLYIREENSLEHLSTGSLPTLLLANTPALAEMMEQRGYTCEFVPSVTDVSATHVKPTGAVSLAINPIPIKGSDLIWELTQMLPDIPFAIQEAGTLDDSDLDRVLRLVKTSTNVEFRRSIPPGPRLYHDARVLLCPYRVNSRPRVIIEAQANGIPVLASDLPALQEAVGPGGILLPVDDASAWAQALRTLWDDPNMHARLSQAARTHAARDEMNPVIIVEQFESLLTRTLSPR